MSDPSKGPAGGPDLERATLGGGCFWCMEAVFLELRGVRSVTPGYAGGTTPDPTYEPVCSGTTGHAEVVEIEFDPRAIGYADLVRIFLTVHDPTTPDRQGPDVGSQYRSIILTHSEAQARTARAVLAEIGAAGVWKKPLVTQVVPRTAFYPAEEYHRQYFRRHPEQSYCQIVIAPKVAHFRERYRDRWLAPAR
ncbi:MAG: peptide-methionine (S)-S-oxide reductase MsrA [Thermoplasmata archaeon]